MRLVLEAPPHMPLLMRPPQDSDLRWQAGMLEVKNYS